MLSGATTTLAQSPLANSSSRRDDSGDFGAKQRRLAYFNRHRLQPGFISADWYSDLLARVPMLRLEGQFLEESRLRVQRAAAEAPAHPAGFLRWFEALLETGPGQAHPLFPWLAEKATEPEMKWFIQQEVAGEAGFDDLVAMTQVKLPCRAKLEMARNYWDEMGQGHGPAMHGALLDRLVDHYQLEPEIDETVPEALALGNTMVGLAVNRRYVYQAVGALGIIELTAPGRAELVNQGLRRLGVPPKARNYFALHATLDIRHSQSWNREVIAPLAAAGPAAARAIAEGALMRLECGAACFARYEQVLRAA